MTMPLRGPENPALGRLAALVDNVVASLESPCSQEPLGSVVADCHAALEVYLEAHRDVCNRDASAMTAAEELKRLARLLTMVDRTDSVLIMRQIRRVLGRFDEMNE